jgi:nuclear transcription factor Y gamma
MHSGKQHQLASHSDRHQNGDKMAAYAVEAARVNTGGTQLDGAELGSGADISQDLRAAPMSHEQRVLQQRVAAHWTGQWNEMREAVEFRNHRLPLAKIKKIMKVGCVGRVRRALSRRLHSAPMFVSQVDEDVRMISKEAPIVFGESRFVARCILRS